MKLSDAEKNSVLFKKIMSHLDDLLDKTHIELEKTSLTIEATAAHRGRIKLIRQLLNLQKADSDESTTDDNF